jgi:two-component system cell cycle sensor histidine kinase/response regulator CckA
MTGWRRAIAHLLPRWARPRPAPVARLIDRLGGPPDELMAMLLDDSPSGVLVVDRAGVVVRANGALCRMIGWRPELPVGQPALSLFTATDRPAVQEALGAVLRGERIRADLVATLDRGLREPPEPDGAVPEGGPTVYLSPRAVREADGRVSGLVMGVVDISTEKRLEAQLAHSHKLQAVGQLAGGIAHDFNNLLTAMIGAADEVLQRPALDAEVRDDVRQIRASADRGAALVRQLLAFGRQQTLQPRVIAINDAITDISGLLRRLLGSNVKLELDLESPGRMVRVDPTQLDQVLVNLAVNARDAMPNGGTLTLHSGHITLFRPLTRGQETIPPGRYVMIEVGDTGVGIPPDVLSRVFDPFFTTRREHGGSGLGLSTVHGIVRQSEGFLAVESEVGQGTRMRVYLPRHEAADGLVAPGAPDPVAAAAVVAPALVQPGPAALRTLLLVDDEMPVLRLAERALSRRGWRVISADSAESALALLDAATMAELSAMVSDVVMPGMDGPALVRQIRRMRPDLPAVLASGYANETLRTQLASEDMCFLPKPYTLQVLLDLVETLIAPPLNPPSSSGVREQDKNEFLRIDPNERLVPQSWLGEFPKLRR